MFRTSVLPMHIEPSSNPTLESTCLGQVQRLPETYSRLTSLSPLQTTTDPPAQKPRISLTRSERRATLFLVRYLEHVSER
jgi:hypothetical protein